MLTDEVIAEGLRLDAERTQGQWVATDGRDIGDNIFSICPPLSNGHQPKRRIAGTYGDTGIPENKANRDFIAHAANNYAAALREVVRLREALAYITDPIAAAKRIVEESNGGLKLDAHMAIALSESANHLKEIARKALEANNDRPLPEVRSGRRGHGSKCGRR